MAFNWDQITKDFQQKYQETFIRVKVAEEFEVFYVSRIFRGSPPYMTIHNKKWGELCLNYVTDFEISFDYPEIGMFNFSKGAALLFARQYQRQWKRGISENTAIVECPYGMFGVGNGVLITASVLEDAFKERVVLSLANATERLDDKVLSVCLTNSLSLGHDTRENDGYLLWYLTAPIAEINQRKEITVKELVFTQEIKDYLRATVAYDYNLV